MKIFARLMALVGLTMVLGGCVVREHSYCRPPHREVIIIHEGPHHRW